MLSCNQLYSYTFVYILIQIIMNILLTRQELKQIDNCYNLTNYSKISKKKYSQTTIYNQRERMFVVDLLGFMDIISDRIVDYRGVVNQIVRVMGNCVQLQYKEQRLKEFGSQINVFHQQIVEMGLHKTKLEKIKEYLYEINAKMGQVYVENKIINDKILDKTQSKLLINILKSQSKSVDLNTISKIQAKYDDQQIQKARQLEVKSLMEEKQSLKSLLIEYKSRIKKLEGQIQEINRKSINLRPVHPQNVEKHQNYQYLNSYNPIKMANNSIKGWIQSENMQQKNQSAYVELNQYKNKFLISNQMILQLQNKLRQQKQKNKALLNECREKQRDKIRIKELQQQIQKSQRQKGLSKNYNQKISELIKELKEQTTKNKILQLKYCQFELQINDFRFKNQQNQQKYLKISEEYKEKAQINIWNKQNMAKQAQNIKKNEKLILYMYQQQSKRLKQIDHLNKQLLKIRKQKMKLNDANQDLISQNQMLKQQNISFYDKLNGYFSDKINVKE